MKRFLKRRWHSIPIGILAVVLALVLVAGSAFAAYTAWEGTAEVQVDEAFNVDPGLTAAIYTDCTVTWDGNTVTVSDMVAGERAQCAIDISNSSSVPLSATVTMAQTSGLPKTTWVVGTQADWLRIMNDGGLPVPVESQYMLQHPDATVGSPLSFTIPGGGMQTIYIWMQAGTDVIPFAYTFELTVER